VTLPAGLAAEFERRHSRLDVWLEVEGIPYAFGLTPRAAAWFAARHVEHRRESTLGLLASLPDGIEQEVRPFDAECSIGQLTAMLLDDGAGVVRSLVANTARRDDRGRLTADLAAPAAASGAPVEVDVAMVAPAGAVVGGLLYVGRETMKITALPGGGVVRVIRGMYRPLGAVESVAYAHTTGDIVTTYPRFFGTRRVYVYVAPLGGTDADKLLRWAGTVRTAKYRAGLALLDVEMESIEADLTTRCFTGQIRGKLVIGCAGAGGVYEEVAEGEAPPLVDRIRLEESSISGRTWTDGERISFRVGDELITGRLQANATYEHEIHFDTADDGRGLFGTFVEEHQPGEEIREVIVVVGYNATGSLEQRTSKFTKGGNPIDVALQFLLSTGTGENGEYDVLPATWGSGLDQSRFDVAAAKALRDRWLQFQTEVRVIEDEFQMDALLGALLRPHLIYPAPVGGDLYGFRFLAPPMPDETLRSITGRQVVGLPSWDADLERVVGRMEMHCDHDPIAGKFRQRFKAEFVEAQEFYAGRFSSPTLESKGQWTGNDPASAKFGATLCTDAETVALRCFDVYRDRLSRPFPVIEIETPYADGLDLTVGELVRATIDGVPDVSTGLPGLADAVVEIRRKTPDERTGKVALGVVQTAYGGQCRLLAPSGIVDAVVDGTHVDLETHEFTAAAAAVDASHFLVDAVVEIRDPTLVTLRRTETIAAIAESRLTLGATAGVQVGDVVVLAPYASQPAAVKARFAFLADATPALGGADAAHEFTP
jgi:hypothetical protein